MITSWLETHHYQNFFYINSKLNQGKTGALKKGIEVAKGEYSITQDGDLEYDVNDIPRLLSYIKINNFDAVIGHRLTKFQKLDPLDITLKMGVVLLTNLFNILYKTSFKDLSGGYKIFKTQEIRSIEIQGKGFTFCYEVVIKLLKKGLAIGELDIKYNARNRKNGKKIRLIDGLHCFYTIISNLR